VNSGDQEGIIETINPVQKYILMWPKGQEGMDIKNKGKELASKINMSPEPF
jgi:hypothetical protein